MLSLSQQTRLKHQHETLLELIEGLNEENLRTRPPNGKWSAYENLAHLAAYQPRFIERLNRIAREDNPQFSRYIAEEDPAFYECVSKTLQELVWQLKSKRSLIENYIKELSTDELMKTGGHTVYGEMNISQWTEFFLLHEAHHIFTIFKLLNVRERTG